MSDNVRQQRRRRRVGFRTTVRQRVTPENESTGKHRSGKIRKGNRWLRGALIQAALAGGTRATKGAFARLGSAAGGANGHLDGGWLAGV